MSSTIQQFEYDIEEGALYPLLNTLISMGLSDRPIPSFSFDRYTNTFRVKGTATQLQGWLDVLEKNQIVLASY